MSNPKPLTKQAMGIEPGLALEASAGGIEELRRDVQRLMDMEAIRQTKHAYFRCLDTANFAELETLLHEDIDVHFVGGTYEWKMKGRAELIGALRSSFHGGAVGQHNGHHPEIQMLSEREATGIWYLEDKMWVIDARFYTGGTAVYWDRYLKENRRWVIRQTRYERIYESAAQLERTPEFSAHYLKKYAG